MMRATMVSIRVKPPSRPAPPGHRCMSLNPHIAGQPINGHGGAPATVAQNQLATAGAAIGKEAHAYHAGRQLLGDGHFDVDSHAGGEGAASLGAVEPHATVADVKDEGLVDVARLRRRARITQLGGDVVGRGAQLMSGARGVEVGKDQGNAERHDRQRDDQLEQGEAFFSAALTWVRIPHHCRANSFTLTIAPITDRMRPPTTTPMTMVRIGVSKLVTRSSWRCSAAS